MENNPIAPQPAGRPTPPTPPVEAPVATQAPSPPPTPGATLPNPAQTVAPAPAPMPAAQPHRVPPTPAPMPAQPSMPSGGPVVPPKKKNKRLIVIIAAVAGVLIALLILAVALGGGKDLGALESRTFSDGQDYSYSVDVFQDAEITSPDSSLVSSTIAVDVATTKNSDDNITSVSYVVVEDVGAAFALVGSTFTKQELYDIYLEGSANSTLENIIATTLSLDDVDIEGDISEWSNANFSDGIQATLSGETEEGTLLTGKVFFSIDDQDKYGYTLVMLAPEATWAENAETWKQIESSLKQN